MIPLGLWYGLRGLAYFVAFLIIFFLFFRSISQYFVSFHFVSLIIISLLVISCDNPLDGFANKDILRKIV